MNLLTKFFNLFKDDPKWSAPATKVKQFQPEPVKTFNPYTNWSIEHYPETGRYYPVWKQSRYIKKDYNTGIYEFIDPDYFYRSDYGITESEAWKMVDLFNEQKFKQNVIILTR